MISKVRKIIFKYTYSILILLTILIIYSCAQFQPTPYAPPEPMEEEVSPSSDYPLEEI